MQKPNLKFDSEEDLKKFLKEAQEKKDDENGKKPEEWHPEDYREKAKPYDYRSEQKRGGMNDKYHYYRMIVFLIAGLFLIAIGDKIVTAIGVGLVALAIILHQATMSIVIREELK